MHNSSTIRIAFITLITLVVASCATQFQVPNIAIAPDKKECVVLVHGLWRSGFAMRSIESDLADHGYTTVSIDYPSMDADIRTLTDTYLTDGVASCEQQNADVIHMVSHSMGGILIRQYLQDRALPPGSKVVMLSPPNQGSELSERFGDTWWYELIVGPAGSSLTKGEHGIIDTLKPVNAHIGIIAAFRGWSLWPQEWLPTPNDGTVSVESMKLPEMRDFILIEDGHAMMRYNDEIQAQIRYFLNQGVFFKSSQPELAAVD